MTSHDKRAFGLVAVLTPWVLAQIKQYSQYLDRVATMLIFEN